MQGYHYFITTALHWDIDEDLLEAMKKNRKKHGKNVSGVAWAIYKVPAPISTDYKILHFEPQFNGTKLVEMGTYK